MDAVQAAHATLSEEERTRAGVFGSSYGDTAAVNFFGRDAGLPPAIGGHNNYWLWGPRGLSGDVMIVIAPSDSELIELFERVERVAGVDCRYCMPYMRRLSVYVCRGLRLPLAEVWPRLKRYI